MPGRGVRFRAKAAVSAKAPYPPVNKRFEYNPLLPPSYGWSGGGLVPGWYRGGTRDRPQMVIFDKICSFNQTGGPPSNLLPLLFRASFCSH